MNKKIFKTDLTYIYMEHKMPQSRPCRKALEDFTSESVNLKEMQFHAWF